MKIASTTKGSSVDEKRVRISDIEYSSLSNEDEKKDEFPDRESVLEEHLEKEESKRLVEGSGVKGVQKGNIERSDVKKGKKIRSSLGDRSMLTETKKNIANTSPVDESVDVSKDVHRTKRSSLKNKDSLRAKIKRKTTVTQGKEEVVTPKGRTDASEDIIGKGSLKEVSIAILKEIKDNLSENKSNNEDKVENIVTIKQEIKTSDRKVRGVGKVSHESLTARFKDIIRKTPSSGEEEDRSVLREENTSLEEEYELEGNDVASKRDNIYEKKIKTIANNKKKRLDIESASSILDKDSIFKIKDKFSRDRTSRNIFGKVFNESENNMMNIENIRSAVEKSLQKYKATKLLGRRRHSDSSDPVISGIIESAEAISNEDSESGKKALSEKDYIHFGKDVYGMSKKEVRLSRKFSVENISDEKQVEAYAEEKPTRGDIQTRVRHKVHYLDKDMDPKAIKKKQDVTTRKGIRTKKVRRRPTFIKGKLLITFCINLGNGMKELNLQGKLTEEKFERRITDEDIPSIVAFISSKPQIVSLNLSYNRITHKGAGFIFEFLSTNSTLISLNLMNNEIETLLEKDTILLIDNTTLKELRLQGNMLSTQGGISLSEMLRENNSLEILDIAQTDQTIQSTLYITKALMSTQGGNSTLRVLDLSRLLGVKRYKLHTRYIAEVLFRFFKCNTSLTELHLAKNELDDNDIEIMIAGLKNNRILELLDLSANQITSIGLQYIIATLPSTNIQALMLSRNSIDSSGAVELAQALNVCKISLLDASHNDISDLGIIEIAQAKKATPLLAFFIIGNPFTTICLKFILKAIKEGGLQASGLDIGLYWDASKTLQYGYLPGIDQYKTAFYRTSAKPPHEDVCTNKKVHIYWNHKPFCQQMMNERITGVMSDTLGYCPY